MIASTRVKVLGAVVAIAAAVGVSAPAQALSDYGGVRATWLGNNANGWPVPADRGGVFRFLRDNGHADDTFGGTLVTNNPVNTFIGICLETNENIPSGATTYRIRDVADAPIVGPGSPMGAQRAAGVEKLVQLAFEGYLANALTAGQTTVLAFQMALWELSMDRDASLAYNLTDGTFTYSTSNTTAFNTAQGWLGELWADRNGTALLRAANLFAMTRGRPDAAGQDMLVQTPLPAAAWLLASGLLGLFGISRRRRTVAG